MFRVLDVMLSSVSTIQVVSMLRAVGIDYDIQAIDITDPNPVAMLLLCTHLYQVLPPYLPKVIYMSQLLEPDRVMRRGVETISFTMIR